MSIGKYKVMPLYMLRTPLKSQEFYNDIFNNSLNESEQKELIYGIYKEEDIKEAIQIASRDLSLMINRGDEKLNDDVLLSLVKYFIRMSSRPTPFGIFSGVDIGNFDNTTKVILENNIAKKLARVDLEWLCNVIKLIENDHDIKSDLKIKFNDICYVKGERFYNPYVTNCGVLENGSYILNSSIRHTRQVKNVIEKSKEFIKLKDIYNYLIINNPNVDSKKIELFLKNLIKNEFLLTELRFPMINEDPLSYVISILQNIDSAKNYYLRLKKVQQLINEYNTYEIGRGEEKLSQIYKEMQSLFECKNYLQVDTKLNTNRNKLSTKVAEEIEKLVQALIKIYPDTVELKYITDYKEEFLEKYGYYMEVPVIQLLDDDLGLGSPAGYMMPVSNKIVKNNFETQKLLKLKDMLKYKYLNCIKENCEEIRINDKDIEYLSKDEKQNEFDLPDSMEVYLKVISECKENIDNGIFNLEITGCMGSLAAGESFGRFNHLFGENKFIEEFEKTRCNLKDSEYIAVEIYEFPTSGRLGNVAINNNGIQHYIAIAANDCFEKEKISIQDIVIGVDAETNKFYAKSISLNKKLRVDSTNMLNIMKCSNVLRFLHDISINNKINFLESISALNLDGFIYMPRIVYGKTILKPKTWNISKQLLKFNEKDNSEQNLMKLNCFVEEWKINRFVNLKEYDNTLLLDLKNHLHLKLLINKISKNDNVIVLTEVIDSLNNTWVKDIINNEYKHELVVPLMYHKKKEKNNNIVESREITALKMKNNINNSVSEEALNHNNRIILPGDDNWLYLKLYYNSDRLEELIGFDIMEFCENLKKQGIIDRHFYILYSVPKNHVRLRIRAKESGAFGMLFTIISSWTKALQAKGIINDISINVYVKEIERYGGIGIIEIAEKCFEQDSILIERIISMKNLNQMTLLDEQIGIINMIAIMDAFGLSISEQELWLTKYISPKEYREEFKKERKTFIKTIEEIYSLNNPEVVNLIEIMKPRGEVIKIYKEEIDKLDELDNLTNSKEDILSSIIHMFFNRYKGNNEWERKLRALTRHSIYAYNKYKKYYLGQKHE
ncbi:lantibiotic dehydratase [Clostridium perfringens]|nr:lantibiotic dehydratase [Clostridium perfringens]